MKESVEDSKFKKIKELNESKPKEICESIDLLNAMHKNVKMGIDGIIDVLPSVNDKALRQELANELERYGEFSKRIEELLFSMGEAPENEGFFAKLSSKISAAMNTMLDSTSSHIAEMMIQGGTMGVTDATKLLREYENTSCSEESLALTRKIIEYEEATLERLKSFL